MGEPGRVGLRLGDPGSEVPGLTPAVGEDSLVSTQHDFLPWAGRKDPELWERSGRGPGTLGEVRESGKESSDPSRRTHVRADTVPSVGGDRMPNRMGFLGDRG